MNKVIEVRDLHIKPDNFKKQIEQRLGTLHANYIAVAANMANGMGSGRAYDQIAFTKNQIMNLFMKQHNEIIALKKQRSMLLRKALEERKKRQAMAKYFKFNYEDGAGHLNK